MPSPIELKGMLDLSLFLEKLPDRLQAFQRHVTSEIAIAFTKQLQSKADRNDKDLSDYTKDMKVVQVEGGKPKIAYASVYEGKTVKVADLDPATTLLYVRRPDAPRDPVYSFLAAYAPFDVALFPVGIPIDMVYLVSRKVSPSEVDMVRQRNIQDRPKLIEALEQAKLRGISIDRVDISQATALNDIAFLVLRKELGLGLAKKPHWRPAIRMIGVGSTLKGITASKTVSRLMSGRYRAYDKLGMLSDKATAKEVLVTKPFQDKILGD